VAAGAAAMIAYLLILLAVALGGYLLAAMFWPEHF
jgi:K+-transporting ATPase KdpF subunit